MKNGDSTGIVLTFSETVTGLSADDITVTNDTGEVTLGTLSGSGTAWTLSLLSVGKEGNVLVSVADFGTYDVMTPSQTVAVYKDTRTQVSFTAEQTGGTSGKADSTGIVLTFSENVTGLSAGDITITDGTGEVTKGTLAGSGTKWTLALSSVEKEGNVTVEVADFGMFDVTTPSQTVAVYKDTRTKVGFTAAQTGGTSGKANSTGIVLTFSQDVTGLSAGDITVTNGTGEVTLGTLAGSGTAWTLALSSVGKEGNVSVSVVDFGTFDVTTLSQTVTVFKDTRTQVNFTAAQTGGTSGIANSTGIVLTFSEDVTGLSASDITITDGTGKVTKGTLSGSGTAWTLSLVSVGKEGNVTVKVADFGTFDVTTPSQTVAVYKDTRTPVNFTAAQTGGTSGKADSTGIVLTFSEDVTGLSADDITVTNGTGDYARDTFGKRNNMDALAFKRGKRGERNR